MDRIFRIDFYPHEWLTETGHMTPEQRGIYINICALIYAKRGPIMNDAAHIARSANCSPRMAKTIIKQLINSEDLHVVRGTFITQKRCELELNKKRTHLESSARGGRNKSENESKDKNNNNIDSSEYDNSLCSSSLSLSPSLSLNNSEVPSSLFPPDDEKLPVKKPKRDYPIKFDYDRGTFAGDLEAMSQVWAEAYPAINIAAEIRKAAAWLMANKKNRKSDIPRFLNTWLARSQDRAMPLPGARAQPKTFQQMEDDEFNAAIERVARKRAATSNE